MSILVQCPNPACGRAHRVKNKYAGKRCHCPACNAILVVPTVQVDPESPYPPTPLPREADPTTVDLDLRSLADYPASEPAAPYEEDETALVEFGHLEALEEEVPPTQPPHKRRPAARHAEPVETEETFVADFLEMDGTEETTLLSEEAGRPARKRPAPVELEALEDEEEESPGRQAKGGRKWLWVVLGLVVLGSGAAAALYFAPWK